MAKPLYLLDLDVLAELTRPAGNRRVHTLFQQRQFGCALAAPALYALIRGIGALPEGPRRHQLGAFASELLKGSLPVLAFERESALWLARENNRRGSLSSSWTVMEGQLAGIAAAHEMSLVTRNPTLYGNAPGLRCEDWFRP